MAIASQKFGRFLSLLLYVVALSVQSSFAGRTISSVADDGQTQEAGVSPVAEELSYQTDPFTGAFSYSVPIKLPPARSGLAPKLAFTYNSGGADSWVGWGWSLTAGYIEYDTRDGVPILPGPNPQYTGAQFICVMNGKTVRLAPVGGPLGEYRAQIETDFSKYVYDGASWIVTDRSGIKHYFGTTAQARLVNPNVTGNGTFHWGLERVVDPNGNEIGYLYGKYMHYNGRNSISPLYLKTIQYNRHISASSGAFHQISFGVQTRGVGFSSSSARMGVNVQSDYVLSSLSIMTIGAGGQSGAGYGYRFIYSNPGSRTLLRAIEEAIPGPSLPGLARFEFDYTESEKRFENVKDWGPLQSQGQTSGAWNSIRARNTGADTYLDLRDMNGDGLPDRVMRKAAAPFDNVVVQANTGTGFGSQENWFLGGNRGHTTSAWGGIAAIGADFDCFLDLLDVNDDGLPDRVYREPSVFPGEYSLYVTTNSGYSSTGFSFGPIILYSNLIDNPGGNAAWGSIQAGDLATYVDMFDINGDGASDRVTRKYSAPYDSLSVQLAQRTIHSGRPSVDWRPSAQFSGLSSQAQSTAAWNSITSMDANGHVYVGMFDINGDGLPDRVMRKVSSPYDRFLVQINLGWRFESPIEWGFTGAAASIGWGSVVGRSNGSQITVLADLDGDGLIDRVKRSAAPYNSFLVEKNTNIQFQDGGLWTNVAGGPTTPDPEWRSPAYTVSGATIVDLVDINGDDLLDRVLRKSASPYNVLQVQLNAGPVPNLLKAVRNCLGGSISIEYEPSTKYDNRSDGSEHMFGDRRSLLPYVIHCVKSVTVNDGMFTPSVTSYARSGGYFDPITREFRGFHSSSSINPVGKRTNYFFHQGGGIQRPGEGEYQDGFGKQGIAYRVETRDAAGNLFSETYNKVEVSNPAVGSYFPRITQSTTLDYDGEGSSRTKAIQYAYNATNGNLEGTAYLGEITGFNPSDHSFTQAGNDEVYVRLTYATITAEIVNRPEYITVSSDLAGTSWLKRVKRGWDVRGNLTSIGDWYNATGAYLTTSFVPDPIYGSITAVTSPVGITTLIGLDPEYHLYPITRTVGGQTTTATFDPLTGNLLSVIDPKERVTKRTYDALGRWTSTKVSKSAEEEEPSQLIDEIVYFPSAIPAYTGAAQTYVTPTVVHRAFDPNDPAGGIYSTVYCDGFGRTVQSQEEAENGQVRVTDIEYDATGQVQFVSRPRFESGGAYITPSANPIGTRYIYDALDRPTEIIPPLGDNASPTGTTFIDYKDAGDPWATVVVGPDSKTKKTFHDAFGRAVKRVDLSQDGDAVIDYIYDKVGNLCQTNLGSGADIRQTIITYDSLGRRVTLTDPSLGNSTYTYDECSRPKTQTDAKNQVVAFTYDDPLGRLTKKEVFSSTAALESTTAYFYDTSDDPSYDVGPGELARVLGPEETVRFGYDFRGRTTRVGRTLHKNSQTYVSEFGFDDGNRLTTVMYPAGTATIKYSYDSVGHTSQVESLAGTGTKEIFWSDPVYDELGRLASVAHGNGTVDSREFYPGSQRPLRARTTKGGAELQSLTYTYDCMSNITSITDEVNTGAANLGMSAIIYDDFNRVKSFTSTATSTALLYTYGVYGNLTTNAEGSGAMYQYDSSHPDRVASANGVAFGYDLNGNVTSRGNQTLGYNSENQLINVSSSQSSVTFGYGTDGQRLWRQSGSSVAYWVGQTLELREGKVLCHVLVDGARVATFEPMGGVFAEAEAGNGPTYASTIGKWLDFPFQQGRTGFTSIVFAALLIGGIVVSNVRRTGLGRQSSLVAVAGRRSWGNLVISLPVLVGMLVPGFVTTAEAATYTPVFYYYHQDRLGSNTLLTDRSGEIVQRYRYSAFGRTAYQENTQAVELSNRYTDQVLDADIGLYYYGGRYYDADAARFMQADPTVPDPLDPQSFNRYSYVRNNPLNRIDPSGFDDFGIGDSGVWYRAGGSSGDVVVSYFDDSYWDPEVGSDFYGDDSSDGGDPWYDGNLYNGEVTNVEVTYSYSYAAPPPAPKPWYKTLSGWRNVAGFASMLPGIGTIAGIAEGAIAVAQGDYSSAATALGGAALATVGLGAVTKLGTLAKGISAARATKAAVAAKSVAGAESRMVTVLGSGRDVSAYAGKPGFNVLNMNALPEAEWARTNAQWLNAAMRRGDDLWLVTDPAKHSKLMQQLGKESYYLDLELPMLEQFGAKAVPKFP